MLGTLFWGEKLLNKTVTDIDSKALDALIKRVQEAMEHDLALSTEDCQLLLDALLMLVDMQAHLASNDITILKLKKLAGMVKSSEKLESSLGEERSKKTSSRTKKASARTKNNAINKVKPCVKHHKHDELKACFALNVKKVSFINMSLRRYYALLVKVLLRLSSM